MLIKTIRIPEGYRRLQGGSMTPLGRVVILAGPNGGGKTRILNAVTHLCSRKLLPSERDATQSYAMQQEQELASQLSRAEEFAGTEKGDHIAQSATSIRERLRGTLEHLEDDQRVSFDGEPPRRKPVVVHYYTRDPRFRDFRDFTWHSSEVALEQCRNSFGLPSIGESVAAAIHHAGALYFMSKGAPSGTYTRERIDELEELWFRLNRSVTTFLHEPIGWNSSGPTLFGESLSADKLSVGQRILLQIAVSLAWQKSDDNDLILILDEPENHLHPAALVDVLKKVDDACPNAQIWIATHSIHVIAHYGADSVWSVIDGKASWAGRDVLRVLNSLVGDDVRIEQTLQLLSSPVHAAMMTFAAECLRPPLVADTSPSDPQTSQIAKVLHERRRSDERLRVVDFGAGQGRLLGELIAGTPSPASWVDYFAADQPDIDQAHKNRCLERLESAYPGESSARYLVGLQDIRARVNCGTVHCIVMCNVLHEVDPSSWIELLGPESAIYHALGDSGFLLVVEDQHLPTGERAHAFNFLVFDNYELKVLFGLKNENDDILTISHPKRPDRLKIHRIPKHVLMNISSRTRSAALHALQSSARSRAQELANTGAMDSATARLFAFWTMQHFNATNALSSFPLE